MNHCDFEYGACYLDSCNGAVFFAPHMSDVVSTTYTIETVGNCGSLLIVGGSNAMLSYEDRADRKFKFSEGTNGGIVSFQGVYNTVAAVINKSPFCNIIGGKIIRVQPYFYNLNLGAGTFDTRTLTSLQCPTFMVTTNDTRTIILDKKIYGGMGKINEFTVQTNNTTLDIYIADGTTTKLLYSFSNSMYKKYKFK